ncbi:ATP-binding protein [Novosphingobium aerophilum]|uniref:histidine kinase n=2 Tax=Novosphingobium aerophilum TaxID=2839843 RepID=A0A7X1F8E2_9SPHN|nr:ATP-binding protein [Novosphingobium aerophilum]MBC2652313.1 hypothetical protein [Novosphingobium aerophilum]
MQQSLFRPQSGLMLARARVAMVILFGIWVVLDSDQSARAATEALPLFLLYLAASFSLLIIAKRSWWWDHHFALGGLFVDGMMFVTGLYLTKAVTLDLFGVFITLFAFIILSSATRWNLKITITISFLLVISFSLVGLIIHFFEQELEWAPLLRRLGYMSLLAVLLVWFVRSRPWGVVPRFAPISAFEGHDPLDDLLRYCMSVCAANSGFVTWLEDGSDTLRIVGRSGVQLRQAPSQQDNPFLFDVERRRVLMIEREGRFSTIQGEAAAGVFGDALEGEGLAIPFRARAGRGQLVLGGLHSLCFDDLYLAMGMAEELARALDDEAGQAIARELAMSRLRAQLAADLHDGVSQTLAGVQFRLEALRSQMVAGVASPDDVMKISQGVAAEQQHVRTMIDWLHRGTISSGQRDLRQELASLVATLAGQWDVDIEFDEGGNRIPVSTTLVYEFQQILREAIANAVRHGGAKHILLTLANHTDGAFEMEVRDNGSGCAAGIEPLSIAKRVKAMGGALRFSSSSTHTSVLIQLPGTST